MPSSLLFGDRPSSVSGRWCQVIKSVPMSNASPSSYKRPTQLRMCGNTAFIGWLLRVGNQKQTTGKHSILAKYYGSSVGSG